MYLKLFVLFLLLRQVRCESAVVYKSKDIKCLPSPRFVENTTCYIKALSWNKAVAQMDCYLIKPMRNVSVEIQVLRKDYTNKYQPFLINFTINMCDVIARRNYFTYGVIFQNFLKTFTNVNHSCPVEGHLMARDMYISENLIPVFPLGFYRIDVKATEYYLDNTSDEVGTVTLTFEAMERIKLRNKKPRQSSLFNENLNND